MAKSNQYGDRHILNENRYNSYDSADQPSVDPDDELNLKQLLVVIWRRKVLMLGIIVLSGLVAAVLSYSATPAYESSGSILIYQSKRGFLNSDKENTGLLDLLSGLYNIDLGSSIDNEMQVLRSRKMALHIADSLLRNPVMPNGRQYPVLFYSYPDDSALAGRDTIAMRLQERLEIKKASAGSDLINLMYESPSALAAGRVITIAQEQFLTLPNGSADSLVYSAGSFLQKERSSLQDSIRSTRQKLQQLNQNSSPQPSSNNSVNSDETQIKLVQKLRAYEALSAGLSRQSVESAIQERSQFGLGRIIDHGTTPIKPAGAGMLLYILLGLLAGAALGTGILFVDIAFGSTIHAAADMRRERVPLLAVIPSPDEASIEDFNSDVNSDGAPEMITLTRPDAPVSDAYRRLEDNLLYRRESGAVRSIVITGASADEDTSIITTNLGVVLAEAGRKVVTVDANFRCPGMHKLLGLSQSPGITDVLAKRTQLDGALQSTKAHGLSVVTTGQRPASLSATARSALFLDLIDQLQSQFDYVLIDTPSFGSVSDASAAIQQVDGTIVTAAFNQTTKSALRQVIDKLQGIDTRILGTVLTHYKFNKSNDIYPATDAAGSRKLTGSKSKSS